MKTNSDLEQIFDTIRADSHVLRRDVVAPSVKLLRSIQIDTLREAREMVEKHSIWAADHETELVDISNPALPELDKLIRELELK